MSAVLCQFLFLISFVLNDAATALPIAIKDQLFDEQVNTRGHGVLLAVRVARTKLRCSLMCLGYVGCQSCNYDARTNKCELLQADNTTRASGMWYMKKHEVLLPRDCEDVMRSGATTDGVYTIEIGEAGNRKKVDVFCELSSGEAWTVILKRQDGSVPFKDNVWADYKQGFGKADGEYYLGNDNIHDLTINNGFSYSVRVDLTDDVGKSLYADYTSFSVNSETDKYKLTLGDYLSNSTLADSFSKNGGQKFSTSDQDNDSNSSGNCATINSGGWWYWSCTYCKLTSGYGPNNNQYNSISWNNWPTQYDYFAYAAMKLKRA